MENAPHQKKQTILTSLFIGLVISLITACGTLAWPQNAPPAAQEGHSERVISQSPAVTEPTTLPAPPPTVVGESSIPTNELWAKATLDDIAFGPAQIVLTDTQPLRLIQWVSNQEILLIQGVNPTETIQLYNAYTGQVTPLASAFLIRYPLWLPKTQQVIFITYNGVTKQGEFKVSSVQTRNTDHLHTGVNPPVLASVGEQGGIAWVAEKHSLMSVGRVTEEARSILPDFEGYAHPPDARWHWEYHTANSLTGNWQAVYSSEHFLLIDVVKGVIEEITLPGQQLGVSSRPAKTWALLAVWSPDGGKLAIIATTGDIPIDYVWLYIYDVQTKETTTLEMPPDIYFSNLAWGPNNRFLLVQGDVGPSKNGTVLQGVWLLDIVTGKREAKTLFPPESIGGMVGQELIWSPDGRLIAFHCYKWGQGFAGTCISEVTVK